MWIALLALIGVAALTLRSDDMPTPSKPRVPSKVIQGTGVIFNGQRYIVPGLNVINYLDDPQLRLTMGEDGRVRRAGEPLELVVLHVTKGDKQEVLPGIGPSVGGKRIADHFRNDKDKDGKPHHGGAHFLVDRDMNVYQLADAGNEIAYNASLTTVNNRSVSIENQQGPKGELNAEQLRACAILVRWLCIKAKIPFVYAWPYKGKPIPALAKKDLGGIKGVIGHRDSKNRGWGDPGDAVYSYVKLAGGIPWDFTQGPFPGSQKGKGVV